MIEIILSNQASKFIRNADKILVKRLIQKLEGLQREPIGREYINKNFLTFMKD